MAKLLRLSTASQEIVIGRMVDATDGNTAETGLTIANTDIDIWKTGATTLADKNSGGATHIAGGIYSAVLDATDTNTLGPLKIFVQVAGALAWEDSYEVVPAVVYDALILGTDLLDVSVTQWLGTAAATPTVAGVPEVDVTHWIGTAAATPTVAGVPEVDVTHFNGTAGTFASGIPAVNATQISGDSTAADNLELAFDDSAGAVPWLGVIDQGTAVSASATGIVLRSAAAFADDSLIGATVWAFGSTQGYWQERLITDNALSGDAVTVETWTVTPSGTITYKIFGTAPSSGAGAGLDAAGVRAAVGLASANLDTQLSTIDNFLDTEIADIQARLPAALVSGRIDASVGAMAANVLTATAINADAITAAKVAADVGTEIGTAVWATTTRALTVLDEDTTTLDLDATIRAAVGLASANLDTQLSTIDTVVDAVLADTGTDGVVVAAASKTGYALSASGVDAVWDELQAGHTTPDTFGFFLDSAISGVSTGGVTPGEIADAVWDEALAGHVGAGSAGEALTDAQTGGGLDAAGVRAAVGLATANLDTQLGATKTVVDAVLVDTAEIGAAGAGLTALATQASVNTIDDFLDTEVAAVLAAVDTEVAAILAKTNQLTFGVTNTLNANIEYVNAVQVVGNGETGTEWGPA